MSVFNNRPRSESPSSPTRSDHVLRLGRHRVRLPASRVLRLVLGIGLVLGGVFWFLPVLGLWMLPLGVMVLSIDLPPLRRLRRRTEVWWGRSDTGVRTKKGWSRVTRQVMQFWPGRR